MHKLKKRPNLRIGASPACRGWSTRLRSSSVSDGASSTSELSVFTTLSGGSLFTRSSAASTWAVAIAEEMSVWRTRTGALANRARVRSAFRELGKGAN